MSKLAIRGHATRGKEVIELLEMLGGKNDANLEGKNTECWYFIEHDSFISVYNDFMSDGYITITLEEFLANYPYKVGDKVMLRKKLATIEGMMWHESRNCVRYQARIDAGLSEWCHVGDIRPYAEQPEEIESMYNRMKEADKHRTLIQPKKEEEETLWMNELDCPDGYEFQDEQGNVIHATKIVLKKKPPQYPKTYEECCEVLGDCADELGISCYKSRLIRDLQKLLVCRDAYWKQAVGWKPLEQELTKRVRYGDCEYAYAISDLNGCILQFPTEEMRDTFYENFKELIEAVKELL